MAKTTSSSSSSSGKGAPSKKIASPARNYRKKDAFSPGKMRKGPLSKPNGSEIEVVTTLGDEEIYFILKGGTASAVDVYSLHLKSDIEECLPIKSKLGLVAGFARRHSKENNEVAISHGRI